MKFEADIIKEILDSRGHEKSSIHYQSECVEEWVKEVEGAYPKLCDYRPEWLNYSNENKIGVFPYATLTDVTSATVENVVPYAYKSAILSGNTLVNCVPNYTFVRSRDAGSNDYKVVVDFNFSLTKNKKYLVRANVVKNTFTDGQTELYFDSQESNQYGILDYSQKTGIVFNVVTVNIDGVCRLANKIVNHTVDGEVEITDFMVIEYQDGMENWDIPYFEGMQSVKMPVLSAVGKNLFQVTFEQGSIYSVEGNPVHSATRARSIDFIKLTKGNTYTFSVDSSQENSNIMFREFLTYSTNDYNSFKVGNLGTYKKHFTYTPTEDEYIKFVLINNTTPEGVVDINEVKIQIEYGTQATTYEPYKSIILTTNEEVVLRGVGEVRDELDCLTGGLIQNINEIVINGNESGWGTSGMGNQIETMVFQFNTNSNKSIPHPMPMTYPISDKLPTNIDNSADSEGFIQIQGSDGHGFYVRIKRSRLETQDVPGLKKWLNENPITVKYQLQSAVVKTVDLSIVNQDGKTLSQIKPIEGSMHLNTSGETIKPLFSGEIPVEAITQNLASFVEE